MILIDQTKDVSIGAEKQPLCEKVRWKVGVQSSDPECWELCTDT